MHVRAAQPASVPKLFQKITETSCGYIRVPAHTPKILTKNTSFQSRESRTSEAPTQQAQTDRKSFLAQLAFFPFSVLLFPPLVLSLTHPQDDDTTGHPQKTRTEAPWASSSSRRLCSSCCVVNSGIPTTTVHPSPIFG